MVIGILKLDLHIPLSGSLKEKRMILKSVKDKVRNRFNVSIAEVDDLDKWQRGKIAIVACSSDGAYLSGELNSVVDMIKENGSIELLDYAIETI